jgi:hypothetical protein
VPLGALRPDAVIHYEYQNQLHWFFLEAQLNNQFNQQKYEDYYNSREWTKIFSRNNISSFPKVLIVSPRKPLLQASRIRFIHLPLDLEGMEDIFA